MLHNLHTSAAFLMNGFVAGAVSIVWFVILVTFALKRGSCAPVPLSG